MYFFRSCVVVGFSDERIKLMLAPVSITASLGWPLKPGEEAGSPRLSHLSFADLLLRGGVAPAGNPLDVPRVHIFVRKLAIPMRASKKPAGVQCRCIRVLNLWCRGFGRTSRLNGPRTCIGRWPVDLTCGGFVILVGMNALRRTIRWTLRGPSRRTLSRKSEEVYY